MTSQPAEGTAPLAGRRALVTASSRGLGAEIALALAAAGADLVIHYRSSRKAALEVASASESLGRSAQLVAGDLVTAAACQELVEEALAGGPVDILVNNVGEFHYGAARDHGAERFNRIMAGTAGATFHVTMAVLPAMRSRGWGRIVNIGAQGAEHAAGRRNMGPHMAGKAAVISLTRTLAVEEGRHGITVNAVSPGRIEHRRLAREEAWAMADDAASLGRPGTGRDVAGAVLYLVSPSAAWVTGAVISVTGGQVPPTC